MNPRAVIAASVLLAVGLLAGCTSSDSLAQQYRDGNEKGYIAGDFQIVEIPDADRGEPVVFEGVTETGETVSSDDYRGGVLVVNSGLHDLAQGTALAKSRRAVALTVTTQVSRYNWKHANFGC